MKQIAVTKRLNVFHAKVKPTDHNYLRDLFVAFRHDEDRPMVCCSMMVFPSKLLGNIVDWHEVTSEYRRQGFGTEFRQAVEQFMGPLHSSAGSQDGEKFLEALEQESTS